MNQFAFRTTSLALKALSIISKADTVIHGKENIPSKGTIFVVNHFTRIETLLLPHHIYELTGTPVWSLADYNLFKGTLGVMLDKVGAISTKNPNRDRLIVKSLLTGESPWIIFPEGRMVKSKKIFEKGHFMVGYDKGMHPPHTGAANLALRSEFYRQRLQHMSKIYPQEAQRLLDLFQIDSMERVLNKCTCIVPVNITYYPLRAHENALTRLAQRLMGDIPERVLEELMTEGTMLLSGVDIDIRFGKAIQVDECLKSPEIRRDISSCKKIDFDDHIPSLPRMRKEARNLMHSYMAAIYGMTTVNLDHLLAATLKLLPFAAIDAYDLRRRVFAVQMHNLPSPGVFVHKNLKTNLVHLLSDDRFHHFRDFIKIALDKGVVSKRGARLIKDRSKFDSIFDFNRVRIDNPIAVMANEVEPLATLQRTIRWMATIPQFWLRRKIGQYLIETAQAEFKNDYDQFYIAGESKPKNVGEPFLIKGRTKKVGIVLIHGYMAAPLEVKELAEFLGHSGYYVYAPRLRGHGTAPEDLAVCSYQDWISSVDLGYAVVRNLCKKVVVGGFSTGAGLALDLALRAPDIKGVFAVAPPMRLQDLSARFAPAVDTWNRIMRSFKLGEATKEFVENNPENPHINYFRNPISGVREIERLMESLEPRLPDLSLPALVIQADQDPVVNPKGSKHIFELLGSREKEYVLISFNRHGILRGEGADKVYKKVLAFIRILAQS